MPPPTDMGRAGGLVIGMDPPPPGEHWVMIYDPSGRLLYEGALPPDEEHSFADFLVQKELGLGGSSWSAPGGSSGGWLNQAKDSSLAFETWSADTEAPPPPIARPKPYQPPAQPRPDLGAGLKGRNLAGNHGQSPCNNSSGRINNSQIPPAAHNATADSEPVSSPALSLQQGRGLSAERQLADLANDPDAWVGTGGFGAVFESIVNGMPPGLSQSEEASYIVAQLLYGNDPTGFDTEVGTLSPAVIGVIDQLASEIQSGNSSDITWSAFGSYMDNQADADANAYQSAYLDPSGSGSDPCSDVNAALQSSKTNQRNNQRKANNALRHLDRNIQPPALPPGGNSGGSRRLSGPVRSGNPATGVRSSILALGHHSPLGPHSPGLLFHPGIPLPTPQGPLVTDKTSHQGPVLDNRSFGQIADSIAQARGLQGGTLTPVPLPDWLGESLAAQGLVQFLDSPTTKLLDILTAILGSFVGTDPDPAYDVKETQGAQLEGDLDVARNKIGVLLAFRQKYPTAPTDPSALTNYDGLLTELANLERWYHLQTGEYFGNYP